MKLSKKSAGYACLPDHYFLMQKRLNDYLKGGSYNQNMAVQTRDRSYVNKRDFIFGGNGYDLRNKGTPVFSGLPDNYGSRRRNNQRKRPSIEPLTPPSSAASPPPPPPVLPPPPAVLPLAAPSPTGLTSAQDSLKKAREYVEFLESHPIPKTVEEMNNLLKIRAEIYTRFEATARIIEETKRRRKESQLARQTWETWNIALGQYEIAFNKVKELTNGWKADNYQAALEEAEEQRKVQEANAREQEALARKRARKDTLENLGIQREQAIQQGRVLRNTQLSNSIAHTKAMNAAELERKQAQAVRDGEIHGFNMDKRLQDLKIQDMAAATKREVDIRKIQNQEDKIKAEIARRNAEAELKAANDKKKFELQEAKQRDEFLHRRAEDERKAAFAEQKMKLDEEKLKASTEQRKLEEARKQALHEQRLKELENEGVVKREREARMKWDNLVMQVARAPQRPGRDGALEEFSRWDPMNNPINSVNNRNFYNNYRPMTMENRLEQTVPPYDLPKNYPIYGGNGYYNYTNSYQPNMPTAVSMNFGRKGRTGRRTNWEKYGRPSLRTARDMIRYGVLPPGYEGLRGNPASSYVSSYKPYPLPVTNPPTVGQDSYAPTYTDPGPLDALARGASAMLYGTQQFTSTPNQIFPTTIRNTTSTLPGNAYRMAGIVDSMRGQPLSNAERLSNIKNYAEAAKLINDDATGLTAEQRTSAMNAVAAALPIAATAASGWDTAAKIASGGLKALGWMGENFWPLHDSYQRFRTRRNIYNAVGKVSDFFSGSGLRRRRRRGKRRFRKGSGLRTRKLKFGGMIIPPKKLKKMFSNSKECNCMKN